MATLTLYPTSHTGSWSNGANAMNSTSSYASTTSQSAVYHYYSNFNITSGIPAGAVISKLECFANMYSDVAGSWMGGMIPRISATDVGSFAFTGPSSAVQVYTQSYTSGDLLDLANLTNAKFSIKIGGYRRKADATYVRLSYVRVTITYTEPKGVGLEMGCMF